MRAELKEYQIITNPHPDMAIEGIHTVNGMEGWSVAVACYETATRIYNKYNAQMKKSA